MSESPAAKAYQERIAARRRKMEEALESASRGRSVGRSTTNSPGIQVEHLGAGNNKNSLDTATNTPSVGSHSESSPLPVPAPLQAAAQPVTLPSVQLQVKETPRPHSEPAANTVPQSSEIPEEESKPESPQIELRTYFTGPCLGQDAYAIGLPLSTRMPRKVRNMHQRDVYLTKINEASQDINDFLSNPDIGDDEPLALRMSSLVESTSLVVSHTNLAHPEKDPNLKSVPDEIMAEYHMIMSSKMQFLKELICCIQEESIRIGIVATPVIIDDLEIFFRGIKIHPERLDRLSTLPPLKEDFDSSVKVYLIPSTEGSGIVAKTNCHLMIAFDSSCNADIPEIQRVRRDPFNPDKMAPIIRLVTVNTIEHLLLCRQGGPRFLRYCVRGIAVLRHKAGESKLPYETAVQQCAQAVGDWITRKFEGPLDIAPLPELPFPEEASQSTQSQECNEHMDKRKRASVDISGSMTGSVKPDPKKQKVSDESNVIAEDIADITHVTETQIGTQADIQLATTTTMVPDIATPTIVQDIAIPTMAPDTAAPTMAPDMDIDGDETESDEERGLAIARPIYQEPEPALEDLPKDQLITLLQAKIDEVRQLQKESARRQYQFEELRREHALLQQAREAEQESHAQATARMDRLAADNTRLTTDLDALKAKHKATLAHLSPSAGASTNAALVKHSAALEASNTSLHSKLAAAEKEASYSREQYQVASNAFRTQATEIAELTAANALLQRRADERVIALREGSAANAVGAREAEIARLNAMLAERDARLRRLELERARRGGMPGTRSGSVPSRASSPSIPPAVTARLKDVV
ncbi:hypothetical protein EDC01DRAFT_257843 [Geopyxis carbonaria]|nr:hypothetical protein EDC01DRAFT_257843 [Geopyxis carbonaria]